MLYCFKGFSRTAARTLGTALTIAGRQGCTAADTGHLLVAMLQTGRGVAVEFLRRKQVTESALLECSARRSCTGRMRRLHRKDLAPETRKAME